MAFDAGAIVGKMVLDKSDWDKSVGKVQIDFNNATARTRQLGEEMVSTSKRVGMVGTKMIMLGTTALAPIGLMVKQLSEHNVVLQSKLHDVSLGFQDLGAGMIRYVIPHIDNLSKMLRDLAGNFNQLPEPMKKFITDLVIVSSFTLIAAGTVLKLTMAIRGLWGNLILAKIGIGNMLETLALLAMYHPVVAAITAITIALAGLVLSTKESREAFLGLLDTMKNKVMGLANFWKNIGAGPVASISDVLTKGSFAVGQKLAEWTAQGKNAFEELGKVWSDSFSVDLGNIDVTGGGSGISKWQEFSAFSEMSSTISNVFFDVMTFKFDNLQQVAADFGNAFLKMLADIFARIVMYFAIIEPLMIAFPELKPALALGSVAGHAEGIDRVPYTGMYKLHADETVVPKYDANNNGKQDVAYNIYANDAASFVEMCARNPEGIHVAVQQAHRNYKTGFRK
jgi:hypothetical protein